MTVVIPAVKGRTVRVRVVLMAVTGQVAVHDGATAVPVIRMGVNKRSEREDP